MIMDQSEIDKLNIMTTQFDPRELTFLRSDIDSGRAVTITVRNTFGDEATCTLYYQVIGKIITARVRSTAGDYIFRTGVRTPSSPLPPPARTRVPPPPPPPPGQDRPG